MSDYEKFLQCKLNLAPFQLENYDWEAGWYSPLGSRIIGWENDAPFAFIEGYGEMVFSSVSIPYGDHPHTHPVANSFTDFLRLLLATRSAVVIENIYAMTHETFDECMQKTDTAHGVDVQRLSRQLQEIFDITPIQDPYRYVRELQQDFDYSKFRYPAEYYDYLGIDVPENLVGLMDIKEPLI